MDVNTLTQLIAGIGFPCAVCIYLLYSNRKREQEFDAREERIINANNDCIKDVTAALNNNTLVMTKLIEKLDK